LKEILVDFEKCNGCLMCVQACAAEHSLSKTIPGALAEGTPARIFLQHVKGSPVPIVCRHCEEAPCVDSCMSGAMKKDPVTGIVTNEGNDQECAGCWMCIMSCPYGVIIQDHRGKTAKALKCDRCQGKEPPACVASCPNNALFFMEPEEFSEIRRRQEAKKILVVS
jgi:carbon-monoxide dehydrogenase iron sulfur subunit